MTIGLWPNWFRLTLTAALSLGIGAFGAGQIWENKSAVAAQALESSARTEGKIESLGPRVAELEAWRRGEEAARAALAKQLEAVATALKEYGVKADDLARSVHRIEGAVLRNEK